MNPITWFEIPCQNLERAERFYNTMLGGHLKRETSGGAPMSIFPHDPKREVGGCLMAAESASKGVVIYLVADNLDEALSRAKAAGGEVVTPRTAIGEHGFIAHVRDSEGNVVGLHKAP